MSRSLLALSASAIALMMAAPVFGQRIHDRSGFWVAGAVSGSSVRINCSLTDCSSDRRTGISGYLQIGGTLSRQTLVGVEANGWRASDAVARREYFTVTAVGYLFPSVDYPFFLKFGVGAGRYGEESSNDISSTGFALQIGTGYDFRLANRIWVGPFVQYISAPDQNAKLDRFPVTSDFSLNVIQAGVKIGRH
jgi:hypothetical protein